MKRTVADNRRRAEGPTTTERRFFPVAQALARLWLALVVALIGCSDSSTVGRRGGLGDECTSVFTCTNPLDCVDGACRERCVNDEDCRIGTCAEFAGGRYCGATTEAEDENTSIGQLQGEGALADEGPETDDGPPTVSGPESPEADAPSEGGGELDPPDASAPDRSRPIDEVMDAGRRSRQPPNASLGPDARPSGDAGAPTATPTPCSGREPLVGTRCDCDGTWECSDGELQCSSEVNACGGCRALTGEPGEPCGESDCGTFECIGLDTLACIGDATNACGGCAPSDADLGDACGDSGCGVISCDGTEVVCVGDELNECGGCGELPAAAGDPCGQADCPGVYACEDNSLVCDGDGVNACGGCEILSGEVGDDCGDCGQYVCDTTTSQLTCDGDYVILEGERSECEYEGLCTEEGTWARTHEVCTGGLAAEEEIIETCTRDTDGAINSVGDWGECEYDHECSETGARTRLISVCADGELVEDLEAEPCTRETDGGIVTGSEGEWSDCSGFANTCDETGTRMRPRQVCSNGTPVADAEEQTCERETDGTLVANGDWSQCSGYSNDCDETGVRARTNRTCSGGAEVDQVEQEGCSRDTDGDVLDAGDWGECGYTSECDERASQSRTVAVCENGAAIDESESRSCSRNTDGIVVEPWSDWSSCTYSSFCDETGTRNRSRITCESGSQATEQEVDECTRSTDYLNSYTGDWGACGGFSLSCDPSGTQSRYVEYCLDGEWVGDTETDACTRTPPTCVQDDYEAGGGNDSISTSILFPRDVFVEDLHTCQDDRDFYWTQVASGECISVGVIFEVLCANVDLGVYDYNGGDPELIGYSSSSTNPYELVEFCAASAMTLVVEIEVDGNGSTPYSMEIATE